MENMIINPVIMEELSLHFKAEQYKLLERKPERITVHGGLDQRYSLVWQLIKRWIIKE